MFKQKLVYVCSPLRGNIEKNIARAKDYCRSVIIAGYAPLAPHVALDGVLDDNKPAERETALALGLELLQRCDELWVFGSVVSVGMAAEIDLAQRFNIPVKKLLYDSGLPAEARAEYDGLSLGEQIKRGRKNANLTQQELANKIQVTNRAVSHWEIGTHKPKPNTVAILSQTLNIPMQALYNAYCKPIGGINL